MSSMGARNSARKGDDLLGLRERARPPRYFGPERLLMPYNQHHAEGQAVLYVLEHGRYQHEYYAAHYILSSSSLLLVSNERVFLVQVTSDRERLVWLEHVSNIAAIESQSNAIVLRLAEKHSGIFEVTDHREIIPADASQVTDLYDSILKLLKHVKLLRTAAVATPSRRESIAPVQ